MFLLPQKFWKVEKTAKKGRGVFATKYIAPGTIIGDYIGKIIRAQDEDKYDKNNAVYVMYYSEQASIWPNPKKTGIHLINHSCTPNCWMYTYKGHTLFFALRRIFKGEELTVSYLLSPLEDNPKSPPHICRCESVLCFQSMHALPKMYDAWSELQDKVEKKQKRARIKYGQELAPFVFYPENISDHLIYPLFGSNKRPAKRLSNKKLPSYKSLRELLRETGQTLYFSKLGVKVYGVYGNLIVSEKA